jgi:hypothetical protein
MLRVNCTIPILSSVYVVRIQNFVIVGPGKNRSLYGPQLEQLLNFILKVKERE